MMTAAASGSLPSSAFASGRHRSLSPSSTMPAETDARCNCCPYGFHIDLGFVQYAADVSSGGGPRTDQLSRVKKRTRRQLNDVQPMSRRRTELKSDRNGNVVSPESTPSPLLDRTDMFSPLDSIFSDSLENVMSDFDETYSTHSLSRGGRGGARVPVLSTLPARRAGVRLDGYQSDYGYAIPSQIRQNTPTDDRMARLKATGGLARPSALDLPPKRVEFESRQDRRASVGASGVSAVVPRRNGLPEYRGISGRIAANLDNLADSLHPPPGRAQPQRAAPLTRHYKSESTLADRSDRLAAYPAAPLGQYAAISHRPSHAGAALATVRDQMVASQRQLKALEHKMADLPRLNAEVGELKAEKERLARELMDAKSRITAEEDRLRATRQPPAQSATKFEAQQTRESTTTPESFIKIRSVSVDAPRSTLSYSSTVTSSKPAPAVPRRGESLDRVRAPQPQRTPTTPPAATPPPVPPRPKSAAATAPTTTVGASPLLRTPSGTVLNLDGFHSVRRGRGEVDYSSDSELGVSEQRGASMAASRRTLQHGVVYQPARHVRRVWSSGGGAASDTEDYGEAREEPKTARSPSRYESTEFFKDQVSRWREEFQRNVDSKPVPALVIKKEEVVIKAETSPPPAPSTPTLRRHSSTNTPPPTPTQSKGVGAKLEPEIVKTEAQLYVMASGPCGVCEERQSGRNRASIGVATAPLPQPRPAKCDECAHLRSELEQLTRKKLTLTVGSATEGSQEVRRPSRAVMTNPREAYSIGIMVDIPEAKPEMVTVQTTTEIPKHRVLEIGIGTDPIVCSSASTWTDILETLEKPVQVEAEFRQSLDTSVSCGTEVVPTHDTATGSDRGLITLVDGESETDLDISSLLLERSARAAITLSSTATNTPTISLIEKCVGSAIERQDQASGATVATTEAGQLTDPVLVSIISDRRTVSTATDGVVQRSVFVGTERLELLHKAVDCSSRSRDVHTSAELLPQEPPKPDNQSQGTNTPPRSAGVAASAQTTLEPINDDQVVPRTLGPLNGDDEDEDELWLMPPERATESTGAGDDTVHGHACDHCDRLQYSFTRHVGVGACKVSDRVCLHCDRADTPASDEGAASWPAAEGGAEEEEPFDESRAPGWSFEEDSPAFGRMSSSERRSQSEERESVVRVRTDQSVAAAAQEEEDPSPEADQDHSVEAAGGEEAPVRPPRRKFDLTKPRATRAFELSRAAAAKKLLLTEQKPNFQRGSAASRSLRVDSKKGDSLAYITDRRQPTTTTADDAAKSKSAPTTPLLQRAAVDAAKQPTTSEGLKEKVAIKKDSPMKAKAPPPPPPPVSAKIPRPKVTRYGAAPPASENDVEAAEAEDRITPLRSEMVRLRAWKAHVKPRAPAAAATAAYDNPGAEDGAAPASPDGKLVGHVVEGLPADNDSLSSSSSAASGGSSGSLSDVESMEEGSYDTNGNISNRCNVEGGADEEAPKQQPLLDITEPLKEACDFFNRSLLAEEGVPEEKTTWARQYVQHQWLKAAARRHTNADFVEKFIDLLESHSKQLLQTVVNMYDHNENTALHYAVSHGNFDVVSVLLDSKAADVNRPNKAGYTPVMLGALCPLADDTQTMVVQRLFQIGDVNVKASQHGQTALMLAVSHGKTSTAELLVEAGAGVNIQDEDGSTALMCAAEHGHRDLVRLLLAHTDIDAALADYDGSTALSIAVENGHRDIAVLIYAHSNYGKGTTTNSNTAAMSPSTVTIKETSAPVEI